MRDDTDYEEAFARKWGHGDSYLLRLKNRVDEVMAAARGPIQNLVDERVPYETLTEDELEAKFRFNEDIEALRGLLVGLEKYALDCRQLRRKATVQEPACDFSVVPGAVDVCVLRDLNLGGPSLTNDIEAVVDYVVAHGILKPAQQRLVYYDSDGCLAGAALKAGRWAGTWYDVDGPPWYRPIAASEKACT